MTAQTEAGRALIAEYGVRSGSRFARSVRDIEEQAVVEFSGRLTTAERHINELNVTVHGLVERATEPAPIGVDRLWSVLDGFGAIENGTWVSFQREDAERIASEYALVSDVTLTSVGSDSDG